MNATRKEQVFASEESLRDYLSTTGIHGHGIVAIVAGHFMLMYDDQAHQLVPMVYQDSANPKVITHSKDMAGDFPLRTFKFGLGLCKQLRNQNHTAYLSILVNDHIFATPGWRRQNLANLNLVSDLRRAFYRNAKPLPSSFEAALSEADSDILLRNNNPARTKTDILPKVSPFFSEQGLRSYFIHHTRAALRKLPFFREENGPDSMPRLMFSAHGQVSCLADGEGCGCSGELIEFLRRLDEKAVRTLVFVVPDECRAATEVGFSAFLNLPAPLRKNMECVHAVYGVGGMGDTDPDQPLSLVSRYAEIATP